MPETSLRLAGRTLTNTMHICAFFHSKEEEDQVMMPFYKEAYEQGEKIFHIVDPNKRQEHLSSCANCGIDVDKAQETGQLEVRVWEDAYLKDGYFAGERMIQMLEQVLADSSQKFPRARLMGKMEWALEALPGVNEIIEYEARLNHVIPKYSDPVICVYDLNKHSGSVVLDILRTHPLVIVGGVLQVNPLFVPPDEFLEELKQRKSGPTDSSGPRAYPA